MTRWADAGESLIESLVSIAILGIAVIALLAGMGTAARTSGLHSRASAEVQGLQSFTEAVQDAPYVDCATAYTPSGYTDPSGYTLSASVTGYASGLQYNAVCVAPDQGAQQIKVVIHQSDGRVRDESVVIVKRKPCPTETSC